MRTGGIRLIVRSSDLANKDNALGYRKSYACALSETCNPKAPLPQRERGFYEMASSIPKMHVRTVYFLSLLNTYFFCRIQYRLRSFCFQQD